MGDPKDSVEDDKIVLSTEDKHKISIAKPFIDAARKHGTVETNLKWSGKVDITIHVDCEPFANDLAENKAKIVKALGGDPVATGRMFDQGIAKIRAASRLGAGMSVDANSAAREYERLSSILGTDGKTSLQADGAQSAEESFPSLIKEMVKDVERAGFQCTVEHEDAGPVDHSAEVVDPYALENNNF